jgi:hypothetical protein
VASGALLDVFNGAGATLMYGALAGRYAAKAASENALTSDKSASALVDV